MKAILLLTFLCISTPLLSQKNTIYIIHQPTDMALGLRYDRQISDYGFYLSASKGTYRFDNITCEHIDNITCDHIKVVGGIVNYKSDEAVTRLFSAGISYNIYGALIPEKVSFPVSFDLGCGCRINRFNAGFCMDFIKWEGTINFGYSF